MNTTESNERVFVLDEHGDGSIVWHAYWDGGLTLRIYRGTVANNTINMQHIMNRSIALNFGLPEAGVNAIFRELARGAIAEIHQNQELPPVTQNKDLFSNRHPNPKFWGKDDWVG